MVSVCLYLFVHQPYRLKKFQFFHIGEDQDYFDDDLNRDIFSRISDKSYIPANEMLINLIRKYKGKFKISLSISGITIEQMARYHPEVLESFQELVNTGCVEFLAGTYYQSLSYIYSRKEFIEQVAKHKRIVEKYFNQSPLVFRNSGLLYNDELSEIISKLGFKGVLVDANKVLKNEVEQNYLYTTPNDSRIILFPKNINLSEDISKRFSEKKWSEWPLTPQKYSSWIEKLDGVGDIVNLFMPYEIIGEHHGIETGILDFFKKLPELILSNPNNKFVTPTEAIETLPKRKSLSFKDLTFETKMQTDLLDVWLGNDMQKDAISKYYELEERVHNTNDSHLIEDWRKLSTLDHYFYMNTVQFKSGNKFENVYGSPYDAYLYYMNTLTDIENKLKMKNLKSELSEIRTKQFGTINNSNLSDIKNQVR